MGRSIPSLFSLNRGVVSRLGLARMDVKRLAMAAQVQTNWMPRVLGPMSLRVGWKYLGATLGNAAARFLKFIFATDDTALLELTDLQMRIWVNDALLTRPAVTSAITNGTFAASLAGWTSHDESGATSSWVAPNYMQLVGSGTARAIQEQQVTVANVGVEHAIRIIIARGPVKLRVGSTSGDDDYIKETTLYTGTHSIAFTPAGDFFIRFFSILARNTWISNATIEAAGVVTIPTPWALADLDNVRVDQSADVLFVACAGHQQRRIERRGTRPNARSWSVVLYLSNDGPFKLQNVTPTTISTSGLTGNVTLTSSVPMFKSKHVGALFSLTSVGQTVSGTAAASGLTTPSIRVTGSGIIARTFAVTIAGDATGSLVQLQQSFDNLTWGNAPNSWTANIAATGIYDGLDNQIVYYRMILTTRVAPDSVTMTLTFASGSIRGIARVTDYTNSTTVGAEVLSNFGGTAATEVWQECHWSDLNGWPTSVRLHEGRLWWSGQNGIWGSVSDAFDSFDETYPGAAGTINRSIGSGPVDTINWLLSLKGLLIGAQGTEYSVRASSLDEPLTPTNFNVKGSSSQGSGGVDALKIDQAGYYVNRSRVKVFELAFEVRAYDYQSIDLMELAPELGFPGIVRMDMQRIPDTRLHCIRSDGTAVVAVMNKVEDVLAWVEVTTSGFIEDVITLPALDGHLDDRVYYVVRRIVNGSTVRYLEKWAQEIDCRGDKQLCMLADSHVTYSGGATAVIPAAHLEGQQVVVWADGKDVGTNDSARPWTQNYTVTGGVVTLASAASNVVVGLPYTAQFESSKLGLVQAAESPLNQQKKIGHIGIVLADTYRRGVKFGPTLDDTGSLRMDDMPSVEDGIDVADGTATEYDQNLIEFPGFWTTDLRVCIQAQAPRPATVMAITPDITANS